MSTSPLLRPDQWLSSQPDEFRNELAAIGKTREVSAGTPIYRFEETGGIVGVERGCIELSVEFNCSPLIGLHFAYPNYFFGNRPIKVGVPYAISARARIDSVIRVMALPDLQRMIERTPAWWRPLATMTDYWFDVATCAGLDLMLRNPEQRCIAVLLRLGGYRPFESIVHEPRKVPITQTELATNANLSRSSVNETLAKVEEAKLIHRGYGAIEILQPAELNRMIELAG